jgi:uncharacterized protein (TIGR02453 family)
METPTTFTGFTPKTLGFFARLKRNNNREWFAGHKQEYLAEVLLPARAFVMEMGQALGKVRPGIVADPGASIFRLQRDTRFSSDKAPYKKHLGIFFWQSPGKKLDRPGFYLELDDAGLRLYYGWYLFPPEVLRAYRRAVVDDDLGGELVRAVAKVKKSGMQVGGETYKRIPSGCVVDQSREGLIRHNTLYTELDCGRPAELYSRKLVGYCLRQWRRSAPIYEWVGKALEPEAGL